MRSQKPLALDLEAQILTGRVDLPPAQKQQPKEKETKQPCASQSVLPIENSMHFFPRNKQELTWKGNSEGGNHIM